MLNFSEEYVPEGFLPGASNALAAVVGVGDADAGTGIDRSPPLLHSLHQMDSSYRCWAVWTVLGQTKVQGR